MRRNPGTVVALVAGLTGALASSIAGGVPAGHADCIEPIGGGLFVRFMGPVEVRDAFADASGSLLVSTKVDHIVEVRMTWESLTASGIVGLYPEETDGFRVVLFNPNRDGRDPASVFEVTRTTGWSIYEPGGADDIVLTFIDNNATGATTEGFVDICDAGGGGGCANPVDRNCDGVLDLVDIIGIVECIVRNDPACDCNGDGVTDVGDIVACLDLFDDGGHGSPPCP
jgi:hypothetical protein